MSTSPNFSRLALNAGGPPHLETQSVLIVCYSSRWTPLEWSDEPPADAIVSLHAVAMSGVSPDMARCYVKAFNGCELRRPKHVWALASQGEMTDIRPEPQRRKRTSRRRANGCIPPDADFHGERGASAP